MLRRHLLCALAGALFLGVNACASGEDQGDQGATTSSSNGGGGSGGTATQGGGGGAGGDVLVPHECPAGELALGVDSGGKLLCASPTEPIAAGMRDGCSMAVGFRDACNNCGDHRGGRVQN